MKAMSQVVVLVTLNHCFNQACNSTSLKVKIAMKFFQLFDNLPIRYKLFLSYSTLFILTLALGNTLIYNYVRSTIQENIESQLKSSTDAILSLVKTSTAVSIKNHLRAVAEKNRDITEYFYGLYQQGKLTEVEAKDRVREVMFSQKIGSTGYIYILNSEGVTVMHPRKAHRYVNFSYRPFIQEQIRKKEGYLEYDWVDPEEELIRPKALYMTYFKPWDWIISVSSYRDEFDQLVNIDDFRESILSLKFGKTGYSYVMDRLGNMVVHPQIEKLNLLKKNNGEVAPFIQDMLDQKSGKKIYAWKGPQDEAPKQKLVIFNWIPEYNWIVASSSYQDEFYAPLRTIRSFMFTIVVFLLVLSLWISFRISFSITNPLKELMTHFSSRAVGDFTTRIRQQSKDEVGQLSHYFNLFMERLEVYSHDLKKEIHERELVEKEVMNISEEERRKISQELHDDLGPHIIGIGVLSKVLEAKLEKEKSNEISRIQKISALIEVAIDKTRALSRGLCPVNLMALGLKSSLAEMAADVEEIYSKSCIFHCDSPIMIHDNTVATHLFYIAHEAVHNAIKHSGCSIITIDLSLEQGQLLLIVEDNGRGIPTTKNNQGMGLRIMNFRAKMIAASLDISSATRSGTTISTTLLLGV